MQVHYRSIYKLFSLITGLILLFSAIMPAPVEASPSPLPTAQDDGVRRGRDPQTGLLTFLGADPSNPVRVPGAMRAGMRAEERAASVLGVYGPEFGLQDPARELVVKRTARPARDRQMVRFQQVYQGIPVMGGELIVNSKDDGSLLSINGEISPGLSLSTSARVGAPQAEQSALAMMMRDYQADASAVILTKPELWVYDEHLLRSDLSGPAQLVWRMEASIAGQPVRELVLVDAQHGNVSLHFNQIDASWTTAKTPQPEAAIAQSNALSQSLVPGTASLATYDANHGTSLPGGLVCTQADPTCAGGAGVPDAQFAHVFAGGVYGFYWNHHDRDSINGLGMTIVSTVRYDVNYQNAFWNGEQMVYGDGFGFARADDVVGHELTHGVTQYESNLFYYYQSGAINESFSDVWGEAFDQENGQGNDTAAVKWLMGEDITGLGAIRSMKNPPLFGDPDRIKSTKYYKGGGDNGGVHTNSGVNNKAVYLMVNGGTFNNRTIKPLGWDKVLTIYYEAQTNLLTSAADYLDLYNALYQACLDKIGSEGIVLANCAQVRNATLAVEMNQQPVSNFNPDPGAVCPPGTSKGILYSDDFETGTDGWTLQAPAWTLDIPWNPGGPYATSGVHNLYADDFFTSVDNSASQSANTVLPAGTKSFLYFKHAFGFEFGTSSFYDGGVLEYSVDNGATWTDAGPLFNAGKGYGGTISTLFGNALAGRKAFVADSHGYVGSRYNLTSLAGQNVRFRWRLGTDPVGYSWGWFLDDVSIYQCVPLPSKPMLQAPATGAKLTNYTPTFNWSDSTPALDHYQLQVATDNAFSALVINQNVFGSSDFTPGAPLEIGKTFFWRVQAFNSVNGTRGWSSVFSFKTIPVRPTLIYPVGGVQVPNNLPTFDWDDVPGATSYTIQVDLTKPLAAPYVINKTVAVSDFTPTANLPTNKVLYWRVRANSPAGNSKWSVIANFKSTNIPGILGMLLPSGMAFGQ